MHRGDRDRARRGQAFSPESYRLEVPTLDGHRAARCAMASTSPGAASSTEPPPMTSSSCGQRGSGHEVRLVVVGESRDQGVLASRKTPRKTRVRVRRADPPSRGSRTRRLDRAYSRTAPRSAAEVLAEHGFSGDRLLKLSRRIASDKLRRRGAFLDETRFEDLVGFLALAGVRAACVRYEPEHRQATYGRDGGDPSASWLADILAHRVTDWYRSKADGLAIVATTSTTGSSCRRWTTSPTSTRTSTSSRSSPSTGSASGRTRLGPSTCRSRTGL